MRKPEAFELRRLNRLSLTSRQGRGATVVELIVVTSIAAILAVGALLYYKPAEISLEAEADRIRGDIRLMQMAAMTWGVPLRFTPVSGGYSFSCVRNTGTACAGGTLSATLAAAAGLQTVSFNAQLESGISISGSPSTLDMDSHGRPASGCDTTCTLLTSAYTLDVAGGAKTVTVTIAPITGFAQ